jgi:hypothetical protein
MPSNDFVSKIASFKQEIDINDPVNVGKPSYFDVDHYLDAVEQMIASDEIQFALTMLENLPGYYRDHYPERASAIKSTIYRQLLLPIDYASNDAPKDLLDREAMQARIGAVRCFPRGEIILNLVKSLNEQGYKPCIIEFGPYDYWLPIGLKYQAKLDFEYLPITLDKSTLVKVSYEYPKIEFVEKPTQPLTVYIACEVIEHMFNPKEIADPMLKLGIDPDIVVLSTPLYTLAHGLPDWHSRDLGHVRTWTPKELLDFAESLFGRRKYTHVREFSQVLVGVKANNL